MTTLLLLDTQANTAQRIHHRVASDLFQFDPTCATLKADLESLRAHGDVTQDADFYSLPMARMVDNLLLHGQH